MPADIAHDGGKARSALFSWYLDIILGRVGGVGCNVRFPQDPIALDFHVSMGKFTRNKRVLTQLGTRCFLDVSYTPSRLSASMSGSSWSATLSERPETVRFSSDMRRGGGMRCGGDEAVRKDEAVDGRRAERSYCGVGDVASPSNPPW